MKYTLTIQCDDKAALIAILSGATVSNASSVVAIDDDETGSDEPSVYTAGIPAGAPDSAGTPWDERIHSASKETTAKGIWRKRRNLDDATFKAVMAELQARSVGNGAAPTMPTGAPPPFTPPAGMPTGAPPFTPPANLMPQQSAPPAFTPPQQAPAPTGITFGEFMPKFSAALQSGKLPASDLQGWLQWVGVGDVGALATDPAKLNQLHDTLVSRGIM